MPRNRYKNKHKKDAVSVPVAQAPVSQAPVTPTSRTAQMVIDRIASGGKAYLMENAERILMNSFSLTDEPEFLDVYLNKDKVGQVTQRWLEKYQTRLKAAEKKSPDEFQQVYDDARIKIIDELANPAFRKLIFERLEILQNRLLVSNDARKIELAFMVSPFLRMKDIPWGICGLITGIYERTMRQTLQEAQEQEEVMGTVLETLKEAGQEISDPSELLASPEKLDLVSKKLFQKNPGLLESLEKKADEIIDSFENEVLKGNIQMNLFTKEELLLPFKRMEEEFGKPITEVQPAEGVSKRVVEIMVETLDGIMTPERFQRVRKSVEATAKDWTRRRHKWAIALEIELGWLDENEFDGNPFVRAAYFGELRKKMNEQGTETKGKRQKR